MTVKKITQVLTLLMISTLIPTEAEAQNRAKDKYDVAAYIWPSCHDDPMGRKELWEEGMGEWQVIKRGNPRFEGHYQPKQPLWGYEHDNDPKVMEKWIDAATDHGVNVFIFDWYWYANGPYLESCLNDGFLKANNNQKMKFYVMWANHDVKRNYWNVHRHKDDTSLLWGGAVDRKNFDIIVERLIRQYFHQPNYYTIDGMPVFSIFSLELFMKGVGGQEEAVKALDYFRAEVKKAGFPGLHVQVVRGGNPSPEGVALLKRLNANSVTQYNWGGPHYEDYMRWASEAWERMDKWSQALDIPYFPNASIGWDDSPRFPHKTAKDIVHYNTSPQSFATYMHRAKQYCDARPNQPKLITIFSWNEWIEGGYLLPDMKYGFGYLEAVKEAVNGKYDQYK